MELLLTQNHHKDETRMRQGTTDQIKSAHRKWEPLHGVNPTDSRAASSPCTWPPRRRIDGEHRGSTCPVPDPKSWNGKNGGESWCLGSLWWRRPRQRIQPGGVLRTSSILSFSCPRQYCNGPLRRWCFVSSAESSRNTPVRPPFLLGWKKEMGAGQRVKGNVERRKGVECTHLESRVPFPRPAPCPWFRNENRRIVLSSTIRWAEHLQSRGKRRPIKVGVALETCSSLKPVFEILCALCEDCRNSLRRRNSET